MLDYSYRTNKVSDSIWSCKVHAQEERLNGTPLWDTIEEQFFPTRAKAVEWGSSEVGKLVKTLVERPG